MRIDGRYLQSMTNRRAKNQLFFLSGTILIFSAAMLVVYYVIR
jgi:hypothetical protein